MIHYLQCTRWRTTTAVSWIYKFMWTSLPQFIVKGQGFTDNICSSGMLFKHPKAQQDTYDHFTISFASIHGLFTIHYTNLFTNLPSQLYIGLKYANILPSQLFIQILSHLKICRFFFIRLFLALRPVKLLDRRIVPLTVPAVNLPAPVATPRTPYLGILHGISKTHQMEGRLCSEFLKVLGCME